MTTRLMNTSFHNVSYRRNRNIQYIVIHYTAGTSSKPGSAWGICSWFKEPNAGGSADYCVDDDTIVQYNPDPANYYCWAVGGAKYSHMSTSLGGKYYGKCNNVNSISIEMCSNKKDKKSLADFDRDWYFTEKTINNTVELVKELMKKYKVPVENVIMHHMVTGKHCPTMWVWNEQALQEWYTFISKVKGNKIPDKPEVVDKVCKIAINGNIREYKSKNVKGNNYVAARPFLDDLGYTVGFNSAKKRVIVNNCLTLDVSTIIEGGTSYIHLRETIDFLNQYDDFLFIQDKTIRYDATTDTIIIS